MAYKAWPMEHWKSLEQLLKNLIITWQQGIRIYQSMLIGSMIAGCLLRVIL